jgi:hypothetical protein
MILIFIAVAVVSLNVRRLAVLTIEAGQLQFAILFFAANLVIFSLTQYENWWQAQQLVYYMPILCVTTCIIVTRSRLNTISKFAICAALAFVSMFSSANGVACWIVVLPLLVFMEWPKNRRLVVGLGVAWIIALCLCVALYLDGYEKPWWTPSPSTGFYHPWRAFVYFLGFAGGPLGLERARLSIAAGALMLFGFFAACVYLLRHRDRSLIERAAGWLVIGGYSLVTGALTTIGRVGLATGPSQVPRYLGFSVYLLLALIFLAEILGHDMQKRGVPILRLSLAPNPLALAIILLLIIYQPFMLALSYRQMDSWQTRLLQAKASILLINQLPDSRLTKILYPNVQFLVEKANALDQLRLLRPPLVKTKHLNELPGSAPGAYGDLMLLSRMQEGFSAFGSCTTPQARVPDAIILAYDLGNNDPIAFAMTHPQKISATLPNGVAKIANWSVRFAPSQLPDAPVTISAWAFDATTGQVAQLQGTRMINTAP